MNNVEAKIKVLSIISESEKITPLTIEPSLPASKFLNGQAGWHSYENEIWKHG